MVICCHEFIGQRYYYVKYQTSKVTEYKKIDKLKVILPHEYILLLIIFADINKKESFTSLRGT